MNNKIVRRRGACEHCKRKKIKCDGGLPQCTNCQKQEVFCLYKRSKAVPRRQESQNDGCVTNIPQPDEFFPEYMNFDTFSSELPASCVYADSLDSTLFLDLDLDFSNQATNQSIASSSSSSEAVPTINVEHTSLTNLFPPEIHSWTSPLRKSPSLNENYRTVGESTMRRWANSRKLTFADTSPTFLRIIRQNLQNLELHENSVHIRDLFEKISFQLKNSFTKQATLENLVDSDLTPTLQCGQEVAQHYTEAYFSNYHRRYPFLARLLFDNWLETFICRGCSDQPAQTVIVQVVLAIGYNLESFLLTSTPHGPLTNSHSYILSAMGLINTLMEGPATVLKAQAFLSIAIYYLEIEVNIQKAWSHLSHAVQLALALKLNVQETVLGMATSAEDCYILQRLFWVLYSVERPLAMRLGISSSINDDLIDYCPEGWSSAKSGIAEIPPDDLLCYCQYAKVYSKVIGDLYSSRTSERQINYQGSRASLAAILQKWREYSITSLGDLDLKLRYYEVLFTIYQSGENGVRAARELLADAHLFEIPKTSGTHQIVQITIWACCILLADVFGLNKTRDFYKNSAFLSISGGYFGRLAIAVDEDFGFSELIELIWMAQQRCRKAQGGERT